MKNKDTNVVNFPTKYASLTASLDADFDVDAHFVRELKERAAALLEGYTSGARKEVVERVMLAAQQSTDAERQRQETRRNAVNARIVAETAIGRAVCCLYPDLLASALGDITPVEAQSLADWARETNQSRPVWSMVLEIGSRLVDRGVKPKIALYAVYHKLLQISDDISVVDNPDLMDSEDIQYEFGLFD